MPEALDWTLLLPVETASAAETMDVGRRLAASLGAGDTVALYGDLGSGKTHLVKGICAAFGIDPARVSSPTFTLVNEYPGGDLPIYHLDAYRIERVDEVIEFGFDAYTDGHGLVLIEWPERMEEVLPDDTRRLRLTHLGADRRRIKRLETVWSDD